MMWSRLTIMPISGVFSFLSFGVGTYIMREVATRPGHASDFFGGLVLLRTVLGAVALVLVSLFMSVSGRPAMAMFSAVRKLAA